MTIAAIMMPSFIIEYGIRGKDAVIGMTEALKKYNV